MCEQFLQALHGKSASGIYERRGAAPPLGLAARKLQHGFAAHPENTHFIEGHAGGETMPPK